MMCHVFIAGGGAIGLFSAYFLSMSGFKVTIADKEDFQSSCSMGNAGLIVPSHFTPLAAPGMILNGLKMALQPSAPFGIKMGADPGLLSWGLGFAKSATSKHVERSAPHLLALNKLSNKLYSQVSQELQFSYAQKGLLVLFKELQSLNEEKATARKAWQIGLEAKLLNQEQLKEIEPGVTIDARGGLFFPSDAIIEPDKVIQTLKQELIRRGVTLLNNSMVIRFLKEGRRIVAAEIEEKRFFFDELLVCGGVGSKEMLQQLSVHLKLIAGKGYSFITEGASPLSHPVILKEAGLAISPYSSKTRFAGTMTLGDATDQIDTAKIEGMINNIAAFLPEWKPQVPAKDKIWSGLRPCSFDGLPFIGRPKRYENLIVATGHSMMGMSLAPATGHLVTDLLTGRQPNVELSPFSPDR